MPRQARQHSPTGVYHVMMRGINRNDIFHDENDFLKMEAILRIVSSPLVRNDDPVPAGCAIYAYCLMSNHIHLLIEERGESIDRTVKRIGVAYVSYYNKHYDRIGPLFQGRFRSEVVADPGYFIRLLNYIHLNPVRAGIVQNPGDYKWCSWNEYCLPDETAIHGICEQKTPFSNMSRSELCKLVLSAQLEVDDITLNRERRRMRDEEVLDLLNRLLPDGTSLRLASKLMRKSLIDTALQQGVGLRQIERITGINHVTLARWVGK